MSRPSQPLRLLLALALALGAGFLLLTLITAADSALSVWERMQHLPGAIRAAAVVLLIALAIGSAGVIWRVLRPGRTRAPRASTLDRATVEARAALLDALPQGAPAAAAARAEFDELERRRAEASVQVALFGEISAGKSSLLQALAPHAEPDIGVTGGSTREVSRHVGRLPDGSTLQLADVPGTRESAGAAHAALAAAEAARSHALIYVAEGDLTRAQDQELRALAAYSRPLLLVLNKVDRYRPDELEALLQRLRERYTTLGVRVLPVSAGHLEEVWREWPDGRRERVQRERAPSLGALPAALQALTRAGPQALEPGREAALLAHLDQRLAEAEGAARAAQSEAIVAKYTRRAVVGALAAVAPGTDLVIQGALATGMLRELSALHGLVLRDIDLDAFLARAAGQVRTSASLTLAVAGNALKAFPGLGTLGGGLMHAVAYGLIFDSLGRAAAETLASTAALDREATLSAFLTRLQAPASERLPALVGVALDAWRERDHGTATATTESSSHPARSNPP